MRTPPHNIDAESSVLGACLISETAVIEALDKLTPEDFYLAANGTIFKAIAYLANNQKPVDFVTVTQVLKAGNKLEEVGGVMHISGLANSVPAVTSAGHYASIVAELALRRRIIGAVTRVAAKGYEESISAEEYRSLAEAEVFAATKEISSGGPALVGQILANKTLEKILNQKPGDAGLDTPWRDLNNLIPGLAPGDMITIAARPSMGKTAFALQLSEYIASKYGPVAFFSMEMSKEKLVARLLSSRSGVSGHMIRCGLLDDPQRLSIAKAAAGLSKVKLFIDDEANLTISQVRSRAQRIQAQKGLAMVVIDYLGLMQEKAENRTQEISKISRGIKSMAKALGVPVVALSQLNRAVEQRQDKHPQLADLRESGSLEQDSDLVMFLYREDYYNPNTEKRGLVEVIIAKQRDGPVGSTHLAWLKETTRFMNLLRADIDQGGKNRDHKRVPAGGQ